MTDGKEMREAIKSRFDGNDESKKMQKYIMKQQFESVSTEDANQKFLRSLPSSWSQVSLIMRTKPGVDTLSFDDLYNNLRVFEYDVKGGHDIHEIKEVLQKDKEKAAFDAKELVDFDKNKVECFNWHNTGHFARECRSKGNQKSRRRDAGNTGHKARDNERRPAKHNESKAMVTIDGEGVDWTGHAKDNTEDYALMAFSSSNSGSDTEVTSCSKECENSYAKLKKLYDE
nr:ribonuclease H-like domain-containing protein [Tanacetum cinerariifolium]